ncbi:hypothetical protein QF037_009926 [Streptomyces canus]|uniref:hypothetical protein n=1 Tax=Streptomyces canus TaxID=58343 RepID=UPI002782DFE2|nr:hypothetical protein [Streptomyces canus]MDQ0605493.1 hypothetical protein [Streptomyces canus]
MAVTGRIAAVIARQYGSDTDAVISLIEEAELKVFHKPAHERIAAAVIIYADGDVDRFFRAIREMEIDWRDLLFDAHIENVGWESKVDDYFGAG